VDLVSRPAANPDGVFRALPQAEKTAPVDTETKGMDQKSAPEQFDAKAAIEALAAELRAEIKSALEEKAEVITETPAPAPADDSKAAELAAKLEAVTSKLSALEVELAARGDNAVSGNGSAVSVEEAYASGDRNTKFEIVRKALEARDFALISKLKQSNK